MSLRQDSPASNAMPTPPQALGVDEGPRSDGPDTIRLRNNLCRPSCSRFVTATSSHPRLPALSKYAATSSRARSTTSYSNVEDGMRSRDRAVVLIASTRAVSVRLSASSCSSPVGPPRERKDFPATRMRRVHSLLEAGSRLAISRAKAMVISTPSRSRAARASAWHFHRALSASLNSPSK